MTNSNLKVSRCNRAIVLFAGILIVLGLILQWTELLFTHVVAHNAWLFATLFGEMWNIINLSPTAMQLHRNLYYGPLLLVITGAAILFSRNQRVRSQ